MYTTWCYSDGILSRTADGEPIATYRYEYIPKVKKPIASIALVEDPAYQTHIFLCKAEGIRL